MVTEYKIFGGNQNILSENKPGRDRIIYDLNTKTSKIGYDRLQKYLTNIEIKEILTNNPTRISKVPLAVKNKLLSINKENYIPQFTSDDVLNYINERYKEGQSRYVNSQRWQKFQRDFKEKYGKEFDPEFLKTPEKFREFSGENGLLSIINSFLRGRFGLNDKTEIIRKNSVRLEELKKKSLNEAYDRTQNTPVITLEELRELFAFALDRFNNLKKNILMGQMISRDEYERLILLGFYSHVCAFRDDLGHVILIPQNGLSLDISKKNLYDLSSHKLYLRDFKTSKSHGELTYDIPKILSDLIDEMMKMYPYKRLLIGVEFNDAKSRGDVLTSFIRKISTMSGKKFSKNIRINTIRQAWSTSAQNKSFSERDDLAKKMGHSLVQAEFTYKRKATDDNS